MLARWPGTAEASLLCGGVGERNKRKRGRGAGTMEREKRGSVITCSSTFLKYPSTVLAETLATYVLIYWDALSSAFTAVRCFQFKKGNRIIDYLVSELR